MLAALDQAVLAEKHGPNKPGASGVSIYFPNSQLYARRRSPGRSRTPPSPAASPRTPCGTTSWPIHYTGRRFSGDPRQPAAERAAAVPQRGETITAPGAGPIEVSPIRCPTTWRPPASRSC